MELTIRSKEAMSRWFVTLMPIWNSPRHQSGLSGIRIREACKISMSWAPPKVWHRWFLAALTKYWLSFNCESLYFSVMAGVEITTENITRPQFTWIYYESRLQLFNISLDTPTTLQCKGKTSKGIVFRTASFAIKGKLDLVACLYTAVALRIWSIYQFSWRRKDQRI